MKWLVIAVPVLLSGCISMQSTRMPENKQSYILESSYQEAYRVISQSLVNECGLPAYSIQPAIFPDNNSATINSNAEEIVFWSIDLKKISDTQTAMDFYTTFARHKNKGDRIKAHINKKIAGCVFDEVNL